MSEELNNEPGVVEPMTAPTTAPQSNTYKPVLIGLLIVVVLLIVFNYRDISLWIGWNSKPASDTPVDSSLGVTSAGAATPAQKVGPPQTSVPLAPYVPIPSTPIVPYTPAPVQPSTPPEPSAPVVPYTPQVAPPLAAPAPPQVIVESTPILNTRGVKVIEVTKNSTGVEYPLGGTKTIQVSEVRAFVQPTFSNSTGLLKADAYESVVYKSGPVSPDFPASYAIDGNFNTLAQTVGEDEDVHTLTLTLKEPQLLNKIEVWNRNDGSWNRIRGSTVTLKNSAGEVLKVQDLRGNLVNFVSLLGFWNK